MKSVAIDIKEILESESSLGLVSGENLFVSFEPPKPDNCVTIFDTSGTMPDLTLDSKSYRRDAFQVRVRDRRYLQGSQKIYNIVNVLQALHGITIDGVTYHLIRETSPPIHLGYADKNAIFVVNFEAQRS